MFMFQPGEEGWHGARHMIEDGLLEPLPDAAFALHISPNMPRGVFAGRTGPLLAASDTLRVRVSGPAVTPPCPTTPTTRSRPLRNRHRPAGHGHPAMPVFEPAVITIAHIHAGTTSNVIPEDGRLLGTIRTFSERTRKEAHEGARRVAEHIALAHGMRCEVEIEHGFPVTVNEAG